MIKDLIEKLGVSRRALATFLDSNQSNISRYENHTRNMPFAAIPQVAKLLAMIHKALPATPPQPTAAEKAEAQKRADWCRVLLQIQQKKLAAMQKNYEQAQLMLSIVEQHTKATQELTPKMKSWVAGQQYAANRKTEENGWQPQQVILQKMNALVQEALYWESAISADKN